MPAAVPPRKRAKFLELRQEGYTRRQAAREIGVSESWAKMFEARLAGEVKERIAQGKASQDLPGPIAYHHLCKEAKRALEDFEYFRLRYFGHISTPWQVETAWTVLELLATPDKEYVVENVMPGVGKTTLVHDLACWLTARDRRIRGLIGSASAANAERMLARIKRSFERVSPAKANSDLVDQGLAADAQACLARDFGLFKPVTRDLWTRGEFIVAQSHDDGAITEKEPTWSSYGLDQTFIGNRFDVAFWDDITDKKRARTAETQEQQRDILDVECETRLEPGGLFMVIGQRIGSDDLYRYCLDKVSDEYSDEDEDAGPDDADVERRPMYRHIAYKAHYAEKCYPGSHRRTAKAWPDGCLLDPVRGSWRELAPKMGRPDLFRTVYQQEDGDPAAKWVPKLWITGGGDPETKELHYGCLDVQRVCAEIPRGLKPPVFSVASVDPSGEKYWAVQWWLLAPNAGNQFFVLDVFREKMQANELLDWDANNGRHYGLMDEWQKRSNDLGLPITTWVVEINAAQRYLLAYDHMKRWTRANNVRIIPHSTTTRKLDPEYGPDILRDHFRFGRIRIPYGHDARRPHVLRFIDEITKYPTGRYDDQVMAAWFVFANLPGLTVSHTPVTPQRRPSWVGRVPDVRRMAVVK